MTAPLFSICVIAKNEAESLPHLLGSLTEFCHRGGDVFLLDTGSADATVKVAAAYGCRVFCAGDAFSFIVDSVMALKINLTFVVPPEHHVIKPGAVLFNYAEARNFAASKAHKDMICCPDADETFTHLDIDAINSFIYQGFQRFENDHCYLHDKDGKPINRFFWDARWYDRRAFRWRGTMHETLESIWPQVGPTFRLPTNVCYIEHWPRPSKNKEKYLANLAYACHVDPTNERQAHCFGRELMFRGRYKSAIKQFMKHILMGGDYVDY